MNTITLESERDYLCWRGASGSTVEIVDIAVGTERGVGRGRRLVAKLLSQTMGRTPLVWAITRESNTIARHFYRALGFRTVAVLCQFYGAENGVMYGFDMVGFDRVRLEGFSTHHADGRPI